MDRINYRNKLSAKGTNQVKGLGGSYLMQAEFITTLFRNNQKTQKKETLIFRQDDEEENQVINLYPDMRYQTLKGFGGALTDSAGYVYSLMNEIQKKELLQSYYSRAGLNYTLARVHIDSCDFSLEHYEAVSDAQDETFESFSLDRMKRYIWPLFIDIQDICGQAVEVMISPWSPPSFMKTNGERNNGGKLKPEYRKRWAAYLCKYLIELQNLGMKITRMSIQNEPKATQKWDSCVYTAQEEKEFLRDYLYPEMCNNGLDEIGIFIWDHNKERVYERAMAIIDETTSHMIKGIAFHWYSGDHFEALDLIREIFPDKELILSEACIEYCKYGKEDYLGNAQKYAHDLIGDFNHGMQAFYDWNILLDQEGGPNHVKNFCDAPYLYDTERKELIERNTLSYISHFSHYIMPGARRIAFSKYCEEIELTAFANPDHSIIVVFLNRTDKDIAVNLRIRGELCGMTIASESIGTVVIR